MDSSSFASTATKTPKPDWSQRISGVIGKPLSYVGKPIGSLFGAVGKQAAAAVAPKYENAWQKWGQGFGEQLPRTALDAFLTSREGVPLKALGFGDVGLRSYASTPSTESTGRRLAATVPQVGAWAALSPMGKWPGIGQYGANLTSHLLPKETGALMRTAVGRGASLLGATSAIEAANTASAKIQKQPYNPFTAEHLGSTVASLAPFEGMGWYNDLSKMLAGKQKAKDIINTEQQGQEPVRQQQVPLVPEGEQITSAAVRTPEGVFTGPHHPGILDQLGIQGFEDRESRNTPMFGFQTNKRDFITRDEAALLAQQNGQQLEPFETPGQAHSDEVAQPGTNVPISEGIKKQISPPTDLKQQLNDIEDFTDTSGLANVAQALQDQERRPNEPLMDYTIRTSGLDPELLRQSKDPNTMMASAEKVARRFFGDVLKRSKSDTERLTRDFLNYANVAGLGLHSLKIVPTEMHKTLEGNYEAASWHLPKGPNTSEIVGLLSQAKWDKNITTQTLEFMHSLGHEFFHSQMSKLREGEPIETDEESRIRDSAAKILHDANEANWSRRDMEEMVQSLATGILSPAHGAWLKYRSEFYTPDEEGREEALADMYGLVALGAMADKPGGKVYNNVADLMKYSNEDFRNVAHGMFKDIGLVVNAVKDFLKKAFRWTTPQLQRTENILRNMKGMMRSAEKAQSMTEAFLQHRMIANAEPSKPIEPVDFNRIDRLWTKMGQLPYDPDIKKMIQDVSDMVTPQQRSARRTAELPESLRWFHYFTTIVNLRSAFSQLGDMGRLGFYNAGSISSAAMDAQAQFKNFQTGMYDIKGINRITNPKEAVNKAFNAIGLRQNELDGVDKGRRLRPDELKQIKEYSELKPEDQQFVDKMLDSFSSANMIIARHLVKSYKSIMGNTFGRAWMTHDPTMKWDQAKDLGKALIEQYADMDRLTSDPNADPELVKDIQQGKALIDKYLQEGGDNAAKAYQKVLEPLTTDKLGEPLEAGKAPALLRDYRSYRGILMGKWLPPDNDTPEWHFEGRPGFMSESRPGKYLLIWKKKGEEPMLVGIKSKKEYVKRFKSLADEYNADSAKPDAQREWEYFKGVDKQDESDLVRGMRPDVFNAYNKAMTNLINRVVNNMSREHPESQELIDEMRDELRPASEMLRLMKAPWMQERRLLGGREELNMAESQINYINSVVHSIARREMIGQQKLYMNDPKMRNQPALQKVARQYFNELNNPTERSFGFLKGLIFFNYCMFSPSLAFIELTQQLTNHIPALIHAGVGVRDAYSSVRKANVDYINATVRGLREKAGKSLYQDPRETELVNRFDREYGTGGWLQEYANIGQDANFLSGKNVLAGSGSILDRHSTVGKPLYWFYRLGSKAHNLAIGLNTEVAFLSAFRHFRKTNDEEMSYKLAADITHESMHGGGRSNRPLWFLGIGPANLGPNVGGLMYSLQMYVYGTICQYARYGLDAIANSKLDHSEQAAARKGLAAMLSTQLFFGGLMGIPFATQAIALIQQLFPNSQPKKDIREAFFGAGEWLNSKLHLFGQDRDMGSFIADGATDGLFNSIQGGVNISNRFELGGLMGVNPYGGFDWKNMFGPAADLIQNMLIKAPQDYSRGDPWQAARDLIPNNQIRRLSDLAADGFNIRNKDERLNVKLNDAEKVLMAAGFTPKKVAEYRELSDIQTRADKIQAQEQQEFNRRMAGLVLQGKYSQVGQALWERARTVPNYSPREGAKQIAELVQERQIPYDPTRTGTAVGRTYEASETFRRETPPISETERLLQQFGLTQMMGFPLRLTRTSIEEAQLVDQLMMMYPQMTRVEAKEMVERQLNPAHLMMEGVQPNVSLP